MGTPVVDRGRQPRVQEVLAHVTALDGVRGTAILFVLLYHNVGWNSTVGPLAVRFLRQVIGAGWCGVDLFFCLSGFLITGILYDSLADPHFFRNFYLRRVFRIFPLYYGVLLVLLVVLLVTGQANTQSLYPLLPLAFFLSNTPAYVDLDTSIFVVRYTHHLWSLAIEEQFYLVWPLLVFLVKDRRRLTHLALLLAVVAPLSRFVMIALHQNEYLYFFTFCRQDALLLGGWLALATRGPERARVLAAAPVVCWSAFAIVCTMGFATGNFDFSANPAIESVGYSLLAILGTSLIAVALIPDSPAARVLRARPLRFLGKYSFGLYVFDSILSHLPFMDGLTDRLHIRSASLAHVVLVTVLAAMLFTVSITSFHVYEKPILRLKRFFSYRPAVRQAA